MAKYAKINLSELKFVLRENFNNYKSAYIIACVVALIGVLTGVFTAFRFSDYVTIERITDGDLLEYLRKNTGWFAFLISRVFSFLLVCVLILVLCIKKWSCWLSFFILIYRAYLVGLNCTIFVILFDIAGFINVFVVYLPCNLLELIGIIGITALCFKNAWHYSKCNGIFSSTFWGKSGGTIIFFVCVVSAGFLLEIILFPAFCSAFFIAF